MSALRRGFLAAVPPLEVARRTESVADSARRPDEGVGDGLRWTRPEQRHLTLQFLGAVDDVEALTESVAESVQRFSPFTLSLGGAGAFPTARRASVVWLGVATGADDLAALAGAVATDDRPYRPHLTLARTTRERDVRALVEQLGSGPAGPPWTVDRVVLFDSDTRADGALHTPHAEFQLVGGSGKVGA